MWTAIRAALKVYGVFLLLLLAAGALGWQFVAPPPPAKVVIAAGPAGGMYDAGARRWADHFSRDGIRMEVLETAGSVENLALISADPPRADIAIVQGGVGGEAQYPGLRSLGAVAYEAVWVFLRADLPGKRLRDLASARIAVGPEGSGTRALALELIRAAGVPDAVPLPLRSAEAADALIAGEIDAAMMVSAAPTPTITRLLADPSVRLLDFTPRAEAYLAAFPFLTLVRLPGGSVSLAEDIPREAATLLAPVVQVLVREDTHPEIVLLLLDALSAVQRNRQFFAPAGTFPRPEPTEWPLHDDADRYYRYGPSFLKRYLPFWVAVTIERTWVLIIPLLTILIPLFRFGPPLLRWQIERKIYRWYRDVRAIEAEYEEKGEGADHAALLARLDRIAERVATIRVPLSYGRALYDLRQHIAFVRSLVEGRLPAGGGAGAASSLAQPRL
jgi:TRAP transporter TAXI family solute receptor